MCACEPGFTCSRCRGYTRDDDYEHDFGEEPESAREEELRQAERADLEKRGIQ